MTYSIKILGVAMGEAMLEVSRIGAQKREDKIHRASAYHMLPLCRGEWMSLRTDPSGARLIHKNTTKYPTMMKPLEEWEVLLGSFDQIENELEETGYIRRAYQEYRRIEYQAGKCIIGINIWPMIPPYLEISGPEETDVFDLIYEINLSEHIHTRDTIKEIYKKYGFSDIAGYTSVEFRK